MEKLNQKGNVLRSLSIIFILSASIFDVLDMALQLNHADWTTAHCALKDLQAVGFALLSFNLCTYSLIKIKTFTFMLIIWRVIVLVLNLTVEDPPAWTLLPVYSIYIIWILRIITIKDRGHEYLNQTTFKYVYKTSNTFNVLLPVSTFRGLLQILFTWNNPKYETRLLVNLPHIYSVRNNRFIREPHNQKTIEELMEKTGAKIKLLGSVDESEIIKIDKLLGKRTFTGIRDCRRLAL